ncbi:MAG: BON domain-containing protein [Archangium sp.]|nr:BON domain-containing protein [Archangium sp.]
MPNNDRGQQGYSNRNRGSRGRNGLQRQPLRGSTSSSHNRGFNARSAARSFERDEPQRFEDQRFSGRELGYGGREASSFDHDFDLERSQRESSSSFSTFDRDDYGTHSAFDSGRSFDSSGDRFSRPQNASYNGGFGSLSKGTGPKGYKRSDERLKEDISERIMGMGIDASDVEVSVSNGEVTLSGTVSDRSLRYQLENLTDGISGVTDIVNDIRVKRGGDLELSSSNKTQSPESAAPTDDKTKKDSGATSK